LTCKLGFLPSLRIVAIDQRRTPWRAVPYEVSKIVDTSKAPVQGYHHPWKLGGALIPH
jgi:hypothetical protein